MSGADCFKKKEIQENYTSDRSCLSWNQPSPEILGSTMWWGYEMWVQFFVKIRGKNHQVWKNTQMNIYTVTHDLASPNENKSRYG